MRSVCVVFLLSSRDVFIDLVLNNFSEHKSMFCGKLKGFPEEAINTASEFGTRMHILYQALPKSGGICIQN